MLERVRSFVRQWRSARRERRLEEAQYQDEAQRVRFEHETQKWQGEVGQPKTPKRDW